MKFVHTLAQELKKTIGNIGFLACVIITVGLFLTNGAYNDAATGKTYAIIEAITSLDRSFILEESSFAAQKLILYSVNGYFLMFIPILAAFPFIPNFCAERNSGMIRLVIERTGKFRYYASKFIAALLGGGLAVLFGYLIFGALMFFIFPDISEYQDGLDTIERFSWIFLGKGALGVFLYGAFSSIPAFLMASFVKNRYLITCIPFMLVYLYSSGLTRLEYYGMENGKKFLTDIACTLKPEMVSSLYCTDPNIRNALLINILFTVFAFILFVIIMNRRWDAGE